MHAARARFAHQGFTLIELLVVLTILGLVAGLGLPGFIDAIARNRIVSQHNELQAGLMLARSEAIRRNGNVALCAANVAQDNCQGAWERNWLVWDDLNADGNVDAGETILLVGQVSRNELLSSPSAASHTVFRFSARGLRQLPDPNVAASIRVRATNCPTGQSLSRTVNVLRTGATRSTVDAC